jgi:hypothetical protein
VPKRTFIIALLLAFLAPLMLSESAGKQVRLVIETRVLDGNKAIAWSDRKKVATSVNTPVGFNFNTANLILQTKFTVTSKDNALILIAEGLVKLTDSGGKTQIQASVKTIPIQPGESVLFYPLGSKDKLPGIEIEILLAGDDYKDDGSPFISAGK